MPFVHMHARTNPKSPYPDVDLGLYTKAQRKVGSLPEGIGKPEWRPERGFPTTPGWLHAIMEAQQELSHSNQNVGMPALVLLSAKGAAPLVWNEKMTTEDTVLVVDDIAKAASKLLPQVTITRIPGALHDVFLSTPDARSKAYNTMGQWLLGGVLAPAQGLPIPPKSIVPKDLPHVSAL